MFIILEVKIFCKYGFNNCRKKRLKIMKKRFRTSLLNMHLICLLTTWTYTLNFLTLPYEPSCQYFGWSVGRSVCHDFVLRAGKLHFLLLEQFLGKAWLDWSSC